jgi:hypothetical protein
MRVYDKSIEEMVAQLEAERKFYGEYTELCQKHNLSIAHGWDGQLFFDSGDVADEFQWYLKDQPRWELAVELLDEAVISIGDYVEGTSGKLYEVAEDGAAKHLIGFRVGDRDLTHVHSWQYKRVFRIGED